MLYWTVWTATDDSMSCQVQHFVWLGASKSGGMLGGNDEQDNRDEAFLHIADKTWAYTSISLKYPHTRRIVLRFCPSVAHPRTQG